MELTNEVLKEYCKRSFYNFLRLCWNQVESAPFIDNWHIRMVCDELQERFMTQYTYSKLMNDNKLYDLLLNLPPGSTKSMIISVFFPAWCWIIKPSTRLITVSYSYKIAEELSSKSLRLLQSELYQSLVLFKLTSQAASNIKNSKRGQRFVTSTSGTVTGMHADVIIVDDGNSPQAIYSEASREEARKFVLEILPSRKTDIKKSFTIYVQQRLHDEDVTGIILKTKSRIKHIVVPAINEEGNSFYPDRFPLEYLNNLREQLGTSSFMAQYMQQTVTIDGGIIKKSWIRNEYVPFNRNICYFIDSAYGGKDADCNSILGAYKADNNLYVYSLELNQMEFPELINWLKQNIASNAKIYIEGKASGKSIIQTLKRETSFNIIEIQPKGSKLERKHACSPFFESGRVIINTEINYKAKLIEQLIFDQVKNDDALDTVMYAVETLLKTNKGTYNIK